MKSSNAGNVPFKQVSPNSPVNILTIYNLMILQNPQWKVNKCMLDIKIIFDIQIYIIHYQSIRFNKGDLLNWIIIIFFSKYKWEILAQIKWKAIYGFAYIFDIIIKGKSYVSMSEPNKTNKAFREPNCFIFFMIIYKIENIF